MLDHCGLTVSYFYFQIQEVKDIYRKLRDDVTNAFGKVYDQAVRMAAAVNVEPTKPRICGRQTQKANAPSETIEEHYMRNVAIPLLDHIIAGQPILW